jgi:monoamine oxidase
MAHDDVDVVVIGGGAAGIAAARRLGELSIRCLLVEARARLGGRSWTVTGKSEYPIDLGCGWLHSADRNPWAGVAQRQDRTIDKTPPPWMRPSLTYGFPRAEQFRFIDAREAFDERVETAEDGPDGPASAFLKPGDPWNNLILAVSTFVTGTELDRVSSHDLARYHDTGVNWRITEGLGTTIAAHGEGVPVALENPVSRIDHGGKRLRIETAKGAIACDQAIIALPTPIVADEALFAPALPQKTAAAAALPLGHDDKLFLSLDGANEFPSDSRLFGRIDRVGTGAYHLRPFGRPQIECYFGGSLAADLEAGGERAFFEFARSEMTELIGSSFARRIAPLHVHGWGADPFARGAYSYALPGKADCRAALAQPVDERLFFAGEACSLNDFSTAHGAYLTGIAAAEAVATVRKEKS